ncbi:hypothetical protein M4D55_25075 [Metabacillus idriensis]|uniref:hypothetical protein n=1 Tax=Metabacillus idriensis TaxID=324768 RepID=UPI00174DA7C0|nr:hypothetical protein [Metabacillus idriensis]MCM3599014.1 hypothetical protein [Metabacillus idriensis]
MEEYIVVDATGKIIDSVLLTDNQKIPENHFKPWGDQGFFVPIWSFERNKWIESLTAEEIAVKKEEITNSQNEVSSEEMNAMAILELTNLIFGGNGS